MRNTIKQQKQIQSFLTDNFGKEKGLLLFKSESETLNTIIRKTTGKTKNQLKTLTQTILPRIALYKTFFNEGFSKDKANSCMRKYMLEIVAAKKHSATAKMEKIPGFYYIYSRTFLKIMRTTDLQVSTVNQGIDFYDITITKCLWHTECVENGCEELCSLFCDVDDVTYGGLKKIGFSRTQTLGYGGSCCDFHFFKKKV